MNLDALVAEGLVQRNVSLAPFTTYKLGGDAAYFAEVADLEGLRRIAQAAHADRVDVLPLGRGSNLVVSDRGFHGLAVRQVGIFLDIEMAPDGTVRAGAGVPLPRLARESVKAGRGGLEWCVGIPGSVGGAVKMNAGGHGSDTAQWLMAARILDAGRDTVIERANEELGFRYRKSRVAPHEIVVDATFATEPRATEEGNELLREITAWRREHQPGGTFNAGSVFKNPEHDSAGRIIDELGLKGFRHGGAAVSDKHANFFVAEDDATAQDVYELVTTVRAKVEAASGVELEPEITFVGDFSVGDRL